MFLEITILVVSGIVFGVYFVASRNKRERIDFHGKHVVITGGSQGIGFELSLEVFRQGAHVTIIARNQAKLNEIKCELESIQKKNPTLGSQIIQVESLDISKSYEETQNVFDRVVSKAGPVDVLINNAGTAKSAEFSDMPAQDFENMMRVNYFGGVFCTKAVVSSMKNRHFGRIVFVSSQAGQIGIFGYAGYSATKFALKGFAEALQMELKPYNIYLTLAYPPDTDTPGFKEENIGKPEECQILSDSSGLYTPKVVADGIIKSIKKGSFNCYFGLNGFLLATLTSGASPVTTFKEAMIQILTIPLTRLVAIFLGFHFDSVVKSCHKKKTKAN